MPKQSFASASAYVCARIFSDHAEIIEIINKTRNKNIKKYGDADYIYVYIYIGRISTWCGILMYHRTAARWRYAIYGVACNIDCGYTQRKLNAFERASVVADRRALDFPHVYKYHLMVKHKQGSGSIITP